MCSFNQSYSPGTFAQSKEMPTKFEKFSKISIILELFEQLIFQKFEQMYITFKV